MDKSVKCYNYYVKKDAALPQEVLKISETLQKAGFEACFIGGCVRDILLGKKPKDWDVTTNATPEKIQKLFPETFYENEYGTVGVVNENVSLDENGQPDETLKVVEVTPYRIETGYSDKRRPDEVKYSKNLEDDLKRRDFTINAIALHVPVGESHLSKGHIVDLYKGQEDLGANILRTVGIARERFNEDALRMVRAVRLFAELGFTIEKDTEEATKNSAQLLGHISKERIRDEFVRILMSDDPMKGIEKAHELGVLKYILPELEKGIGVEQNKAHAFDVWEHLLRTVQHSADKKWPLEIRLAALLHDIGKPDTRRMGEKKEWTFYGHEVVGAKMAKKILNDLKFSKKIIVKVTTLIRWHMFFSDTETITLSAVRRLITNVGKENVWDLMNVRVCDRIGTGRPKENPYRLRKYKSMVEEAMRDPVSVGMLKIDGKGIMEIAKLDPGPKIGHILHALLEEVLEEPKKNTEEYLNQKTLELAQLSESELKKIGEQGKEKKKVEEEKEIKEIRKKHWVE